LGAENELKKTNSQSGMEYRPSMNMAVAFVRGSERPEARMEEEKKKPKFTEKPAVKKGMTKPSLKTKDEKSKTSKKNVKFNPNIKVRTFVKDDDEYPDTNLLKELDEEEESLL
jgi:hypothetical protein